MSESEPSTVTQLLARARAGDSQAFDDLYEVVYDEMRRLAHAQRRRWDGENSLTTTSTCDSDVRRLENYLCHLTSQRS